MLLKRQESGILYASASRKDLGSGGVGGLAVSGGVGGLGDDGGLQGVTTTNGCIAAADPT